MSRRQKILLLPHMKHLVGIQAVQNISIEALCALERLMSFCADQGLNNPAEADYEAFAKLCEQSPQDLSNLSCALNALAPNSSIAADIQELSMRIEERQNFKGIPRKTQGGYERRVSVKPCDLPFAWQQTLSRLKSENSFAATILDRMERRLCLFAWSASNASRPIDLSDAAALKALYDDIRSRSANKNQGEPRWAYLRSTWEEFHRFSKAHGLPAHVSANISETKERLAKKEALQDPNKFSKLPAIGTASELLKKAEEILELSRKISAPHMQHAYRNRAAAIAIGVAIPARPNDVFNNHKFGEGIFWEPGRNQYRFRYTPVKTRGVVPEPLNILLDQYWNKYIEALLLHDQDPRYLGKLYAKAVKDKRPLYVNYNNTPCAAPWYSRAWKSVAGTGGHIARTLIYDQMAEKGEFGIKYASGVNHHRSERIREKYRSEFSIREDYRIGQASLIETCVDTDISDLI